MQLLTKVMSHISRSAADLSESHPVLEFKFVDSEAESELLGLVFAAHHEKQSRIYFRICKSNRKPTKR